jgi:hypothetical protein
MLAGYNIGSGVGRPGRHRAVGVDVVVGLAPEGMGSLKLLRLLEV